MKLNNELIKRLANGEIQLKNTGDVKALRCILQNAFPKVIGRIRGTNDYYYKSNNYKNDFDATYNSIDLPIFTTEQFFEHLPDVRNMVQQPTEARELAKQLFVAKMYAGNLPSSNAMNQAIDNAKQFIKLLDENGL